MIALPREPGSSWRASAELVQLRTQCRQQTIDLTDLVAERVRRARIRCGLVSVQARHTTMAVALNENEPLLLEDVDQLLERLAPGDLPYAHDDLGRRLQVFAGERRNGAAHCRSLLLGAGQTLHVLDGRLDLGRWQRLLLLELDGPQPRTLSLLILGERQPR